MSLYLMSLNRNCTAFFKRLPALSEYTRGVLFTLKLLRLHCLRAQPRGEWCHLWSWGWNHLARILATLTEPWICHWNSWPENKKYYLGNIYLHQIKYPIVNLRILNSFQKNVWSFFSEHTILYISFSLSSTQFYKSGIFCLFTFWVSFPDKSFQLISKYTQKCPYNSLC